MSNAVDITGLQAKAIKDWQERVEQLAKPEFFKVKITPSMELLNSLSEAEKPRLFEKLNLVSEYVTYLCAGMVKGTVKYATDQHELKQWMAHVVGEGADQSNYTMLLFNAWRLQQKKEPE